MIQNSEAESVLKDVEAERVLVLIAVCLAALVLPFTFSAGAIATPAIARDLDGSPQALSWVTNAFMLGFGCSVMVAGSLADAYGRKRVFSLGLGAFSLLSLALTLAPDLLWLDVMRGAQGIAAAATLSGGTALLAQVFDGQARLRAFSFLGTSFGVGLAVGPILAGLLLEHMGWRSVFLSGVVIGVPILLFAVPGMVESKDPDFRGIDWFGLLSFMATLVTFTWGVLLAADGGWYDPLVMLLLGLSLLCLILFILVELKSERPALDLSLFRYSRFVGVQVLPLATCYCYVVLLVLLPIRFVGIEQHGESDVGLVMVALSAPMLVVPSLAALLAQRLSPGLISGAGLLVAALGLYWLSQIDTRNSLWEALIPLLIIGFGTGFPWGLMDGLSVSLVPKQQAGMATGLFSTSRVAGEGVALAIVTTALVFLVQQQFDVVGAGNMAAPQTAARQLASGDMNQLISDLPEVPPELLKTAYLSAFQTLLYGLVVITLISALIVFMVLGKERKSAVFSPENKKEIPWGD